MFGLDYVIFRPHNVYGERQNLGDRHRNVLAIFMNQLMQDRDMTIFGDGEQRRAFTYVRDIVPGIARAVLVEQARNQVFNIGADIPYSINQLAERVAAAMDVPCRTQHLDERKEVRVAYSDHAKFDRVFTDTTYTPLDRGIARMAAWAKSTGIQSSQDVDRFEITKGVRSLPAPPSR
jgi:UDP-glucose 4-epimerase